MQVREVEIDCGAGRTMVARFSRPEGTPVATALLTHCFLCSGHSEAADRIAAGLADVGIASLQIDFTGLVGGLAPRVDDLVRAAEWLNDEDHPPSILVGHSLGGGLVLAAAQRIPDAAAVAVLNTPIDAATIVRDFEANLGGEKTFPVEQEVLDALSAPRLLDYVRGLHKALLVFHAPLDGVVSVDNGRLIFETSDHPKSFISLDGADHLLTDPHDAGWVASILSGWARRYLRAHVQLPPIYGDEREAPDTVRVRDHGPGRLAQRIDVGRHRILADEPVTLGGTDTGPTPYDLVLAALGSCTAMTVRLYAERKGWPLEGVDVRLRHRKIHAKDCAECEEAEGRIDHIDRSMRIYGPLDEDQRARLLEMADRCPVHRTLTSRVLIDTELVES